MMKKIVVCFDIDDTLYHEIDYLKSAFKDISEKIKQKYNIECNTYNLMLKWFYDKCDVFDKLIDCFNISTTKSELIGYYRSHVPQICLSNDVKKTLDLLKKKGYVLGIITDGRSLTQRNKINSLGLNKWINNNDIVISEEFGSEKPCEANYKYFMENYPNAEYYYIGDNLKKDFIAPINLGWKCICIEDDGKNIHKQEYSDEKKGNIVFVNNFAELRKCVN